MEHTNASIWFHSHTLKKQKRHHSALTVSLVETRLTHTKRRHTQGTSTHTMKTIGGQFSDKSFHTSSTQHEWGYKSNHIGRNHPHNSEIGAIISNKRGAFSINIVANP